MTIYSRILGTGSYLPPKRITNDDLAKTIDTSDEWIRTRTGIVARHIAENEQTGDMAAKAAQIALDTAGVSIDEIDLIIVATTTPDMTFPSTACIVQNKLGITHRCPAFDIQAVCSGFMYSLVTANQYIQNGMAKKALIIGAETLSHLIDWSDRNTCVLFGDGAGAVVLGASDEAGFIHAKLHADGSYANILNATGKPVNNQLDNSAFIYMDGQAVFKFAVNALAEVGTQTLEEAGYSTQDIDWLVPHQANLRIIASTAKHMKLPMDKVIVTVDEHANTSAASIPLALDNGIRAGKIKRNDLLLLEGIGGGFTWGSVLLRY